MGTLPQAIEVLSTRLNEPLPRTKQISRHLLDAGLLPKSAGKRIEQLGANEIAVYLIALSTAKRPADAPRAFFAWGHMTPNGEPGEAMLMTTIAIMIRLAWDGNGAGPLADAICASTVEITTTHPHAIIELAGRRIEYLPIGGKAPSGRQRVDRIPGATIHQIAMALREGAPIPDAAPVESLPLDFLKSA